jgi:hypothetical protein
MGLITNDGGIALAKMIVATPLYVAMGNGLVAWDSTPDPESSTDVDLESEVGRRVASQVTYATPSETGTIFVSSGNFDLSVSPTRFVYVRGTFDFTDSVDEVIREAGVYAYCTVSGVGPYFEPANVTDKGLMLINTRFTAFTRTNSIRQTFEFVIQV